MLSAVPKRHNSSLEITPMQLLNRSIGCVLAAVLTVPTFFVAQSVYVTDRRGQVFNVRAFGAKGNGSTDDSAAITSAIRAAKGAHGILYFPSGTYDYSTPLNLTSILNLTIEGAGPTESIGGVANANSTLLKYTGPALPSSCPVELTNSSYLILRDISFASSNSVACQVLLGSGQAESFHNEFYDVAISRGSVASVADFGAENTSFYGTLSNIVYGPCIGFLVSSNGGAGYGIKSNFGYTFTGPWSTSGYSFTDTVFDGFAPGHAVEVDGTGLGMDVAFMSFRGVFFQENGSGIGTAAFYVKGAVQNVTFTSPRVEVDAGTRSVAFIEAASRANLINVDAFGLSQVGVVGIYGLYSAFPAVINGMTLTADSPAISWKGNISGLHLQSYSSLNVKISGSLRQSSLDSFTGHGNDSVSVSKAMNADINGLENVVWYAPVFSGSSTFRLPSGGFSTGLYKATYISAGCEFIYSEGFQVGSGDYASVGPVADTTGFGPAQSLSCPTKGTYSAAPSITAKHTNTGGIFIVQKF